MDALAELLKVVKLDSAIFFNAEMTEPWCLLSRPSHELSPWLTRGENHLIVYHLLWEGSAFAELPGHAPVQLTPGDVICVPHGQGHLLGSHPNAERVDTNFALPDMMERGLEVLRLGGGGPKARFICGFLACDKQLSEFFLQSLPDVVKVSIKGDETGVWLENSLRFAVGQASQKDSGTQAMLAKLSELLFVETLRRFVGSLPATEKGLFAALGDPAVSKALALISKSPRDPWTLDQLARQAGVSRTVLSARFGHYLDESPMAYLTGLRLRLGAKALLSSMTSIAQIALEVGYESESAFNRAFKREFGLPPARFRKEQAAASAPQ